MAVNFGDVLTFNGVKWTKLSLPVEQFAATSCPQENFCMALGAYGGNNYIFNGLKWIPGPALSNPSVMIDISCTGAQFCMAIGANDSAWIYDGKKWSLPMSIGVGPFSVVSCASSTFCMAIGGGQLDVYNGSGWSVASNIDITPHDPIASVSCPEYNFCMAIVAGQASNEDDEYSVIYDGSSWSEPIRMSTPIGPFNWTILPSYRVSAKRFAFCRRPIL